MKMVSENVFDLLKNFAKFRIFAIPKKNSNPDSVSLKFYYIILSIFGCLPSLMFGKLLLEKINMTSCYSDVAVRSTFLLLGSLLQWYTIGYYNLQGRNQLKIVLKEVNVINYCLRTEFKVIISKKKFRLIILCALILLFIYCTINIAKATQFLYGATYFSEGMFGLVKLSHETTTVLMMIWMLIAVWVHDILGSIAIRQLQVLKRIDHKKSAVFKLIQLKIMELLEKINESFGLNCFTLLATDFEMALLTIWTMSHPNHSCYFHPYWLGTTCITLLLVVIMETNMLIRKTVSIIFKIYFKIYLVSHID